MSVLFAAAGRVDDPLTAFSVRQGNDNRRNGVQLEWLCNNRDAAARVERFASAKNLVGGGYDDHWRRPKIWQGLARRDKFERVHTPPQDHVQNNHRRSVLAYLP
jgi:hypothetical protein